VQISSMNPSLTLEERVYSRVSTAFVKRIVYGSSHTSWLVRLNNCVSTSTSTSGGSDNCSNDNSDDSSRSETSSDGNNREFRIARNKANSTFTAGGITEGNLARDVGRASFWNVAASVDWIANIVGARIVVIARDVLIDTSNCVVAGVRGAHIVVIAEVVRKRDMLTRSLRITRCFEAFVGR